MLVSQCLECKLFKTEEGKWVELKIDSFQVDISHTYCELCIKKFQEKLLSLKDFKDWDFSHQIQCIKKHLLDEKKKFDANRLKKLLVEFYSIDEVQTPPFIHALKEYLYQSVCSQCYDVIIPDSTSIQFGDCKLHPPCFNDLSKKLDLILKNKWESSQNLEAYLDMLKIEKELRPAVREQLKDESEFYLKNGKKESPNK